MAQDVRHVQTWLCKIASDAGAQPLDIALLRFGTAPTVCITIDQVSTQHASWYSLRQLSAKHAP